MDKLYVYADFDWLAQPELVGELTHERLARGGNTSLNITRRDADA